MIGWFVGSKDELKTRRVVGENEGRKEEKTSPLAELVIRMECGPHNASALSFPNISTRLVMSFR